DVLAWVFPICNFTLELPSTVFDQLSSKDHPQYALIAMLFSFIALMSCIAELIFNAINYSFISRHLDGPIKTSALPILFAFGLLCSKYFEKPDRNRGGNPTD
ncbi:hypothetical protein POUND7_016977, partial [Theobroma cacao]